MLRLICILVSALLITGCVDESRDAEPGEPTAADADTTIRVDEADGTDAPSVDASGYVGLEHPPLPDSIEKRAGALATEPGESAAETEYVFHQVRIGSNDVLWLSRIIDRDASGEVSYRVLDAVAIRVEAGERLVVGQCRSADPERIVTAIAVESDAETLTDIRRAWAVDRGREKLTTIPVEGVECENEGLRAP